MRYFLLLFVLAAVVLADYYDDNIDYEEDSNDLESKVLNRVKPPGGRCRGPNCPPKPCRGRNCPKLCKGPQCRTRKPPCRGPRCHVRPCRGRYCPGVTRRPWMGRPKPWHRIQVTIVLPDINFDFAPPPVEEYCDYHSDEDCQRFVNFCDEHDAENYCEPEAWL